MTPPHRRGPLLTRRAARTILLGICASILAGCASDYVARTGHVRDAYEAYDHEGALVRLAEEEKHLPEKDRLLVLLDRGMLLHAAGKYEESIAVLREAERLADQMDVISVSEEASTLLANERERAYRGEDFERVMINVLLALDYAQLGKDEDALVEVRRVNERLKKLINEDKKPYQQLAVARYLAGALWEDQREWDSAFIDYYEAWKLNPSLGHLAEPLLRLAKKTEREDALRELEAAFPSADARPLAPDEGQLLVVIEHGRAPKKVSTRRNGDLDRRDLNDVFVVPVFEDRWSRKTADVTVGTAARTAVTVTSIEEVAKLHLNDRIGRLIAHSIASTAVKAGLAAGAGALTKSEEVGVLAFWLLTLSNEADLRSWLSLPAEFQLARFRLQEGQHTVAIDAGGKRTEHAVEVKKGRVALLVVRRY